MGRRRRREGERTRGGRGAAPRRRRGRGVLLGAGLVVFVALGLVLAPRSPSTPTRSEGLSLLLVSIDTLRADHLSCYDERFAHTPRLDALAAEGVLFENVSTVAPTTLPAHATMLTGLWPLRHGVRDNVGFRLSTEPPTLASVLRAAGYRTGGFVGAFVLDRRFGLARGFETYADELDAAEQDVAGGFVAQRRGEEVLDDALAWLGTLRGEAAPFFAFVHFYDPHTPYDPPGSVAAGASDRERYAAEVAYVDALVGRLLDALAEAGLDERTVVAVTSDHGEALGDHGERTHGFFLYEATLRVPLVLRWPGGPRARRIGTPVSLVDLMPTLLDLVGVAAPRGLDGRSLLPLVDGAAAPPRLLYAETYLPRLHYGWSALRSVRRGSAKLIRAPRPELYDLAADPGETRNRYDAEPERARPLERALERLGDVAPRPGAVDEETRRRLETLGYAGGGVGEADASLADPKDRLPIYLRLNDPFLVAVAPGDGAAFDRALASLEAVLAEEPELPRANLLYGQLLLRAGRAAEAAAAFERARRARPDAVEPLDGLARAAMARGRLDEARRVLEAALRLDPRSTKVRFRLAEVEEARGRAAEAERWLREAIAIRADRTLEEKLAGVLLSQGKAAEAVAVLEAIARRRPEDARAQYNLGQALLVAGETRAAARVLEEAARLAPDDPDVPHALGNALAAEGRLEEAAAAYRDALALAPCHARALANLGTLLLRRGDREGALDAYRRAVACEPDYALAYKNMASVLLDEGDVAGARRALEQAARLEPSDAEVQAALEALRARRPR